MDLGRDFFLFKFEAKEDMDRVHLEACGSLEVTLWLLDCGSLTLRPPWLW